MSSVRCFLSYSGIALPLQLVEELPPEALSNRNTWFEARHDEAGRVVAIDKRVYGEVEMSHRYRYDADGRLAEAVITLGDEEPRTLQFAGPAARPAPAG